jgi:hypothetical protein
MAEFISRPGQPDESPTKTITTKTLPTNRLSRIFEAVIAIIQRCKPMAIWWNAGCTLVGG